jgi:predicted rRNA methylase YqxC with S4 and FtsJ domains
LLPSEGQILALVKPLFEVEDSIARRTGQIHDPLLIVTALQQVIDAGTACGLAVQGVAKLALHPRHGVHEFFVSFVRRPGALSCFYDAQTLLALIKERGIGHTEEE